MNRNIDNNVISGFGDEWKRFDQSELSNSEKVKIFEDYFSIFPWNLISESSIGADIGCGSGRWATLIAPKVGLLHCVEPSEAINVARKNLHKFSNVMYHDVDIDNLPFRDYELDFAYSLGVLHHIPNTLNALNAISKKLKKGSPLLIYLYYAFDNRPKWFKLIWKMSDIIRKIISKSPYSLRYLFSQIIAVLIYFPLSKCSLFFHNMGINIENFPLSYYKDKSLYTLRTDSLDRFGTSLEHRFTKAQIKELMESSGFENIIFSERSPYWCAVGLKK